MGIFGNLGTDGYCGVISEFWVVRLDGVINHYSTEMTSSFSHQKNASVASNKHDGLQVLQSQHSERVIGCIIYTSDRWRSHLDLRC